MFEKLKLYFRYLRFCWEARVLLEDTALFMSLPEDEGKRYRLELRNLDRKIRNLKTNKDSVTKATYLRYLLYQTFNEQDEDSFDEDLQLPFALIAAWALARKYSNNDVD